MVENRSSRGGSAAQSAIEFLITYGWAVLVIAAILAVLFELNVFSPTLPNTCLSSTPFECQSPLLSETGTLSVTIGELGSTMNVTGLNCTADSGVPSKWYPPQSTTIIHSGGTENMNFTCPLSRLNVTGASFSGRLWIQYTTPSCANTMMQQVAVVTATAAINGTPSS
jgi:hypothetical protein